MFSSISKLEEKGGKWGLVLVIGHSTIWIGKCNLRQSSKMTLYNLGYVKRNVDIVEQSEI